MTRTLLSAPPTERVGRYPKHAFQTREIPFEIVPFMIAPVLPGETINNLHFESRVISDPIKNPIIGWKKEYYFFYVRITDLLNDAIRDMFVDPANTDLTATLGIGANSQVYYTAKGGIDYAQRCLQRVTETYFRDKGEAWNATVSSNGLPMAHVRDIYWMDSLTDKDVMPEGAAIAGATDMGDLDRLYDAFEQLRALGLNQMTYEDFLRSYGIAIPDKDQNKPELLARFSDFQYPSNTVDPSTGIPVSAVSWVFRNDKRDPKFFKEPGFVFGVSLTRPKLYFGGVAGSMAAHMGRAWDWMPNYLWQTPETALKPFAADTGPLGDQTTATDGYFADMRDLLLYGDQWQNIVAFNPAPVNVGAQHIIALPTANNHQAKKVTDAMVKEFFTTPASAFYIRQDGYCSLSIKGRMVDYTQGTMATM